MGLVAKAFQDIITFSRASSGTYVNSNGYITNSSVLNYLTYSNAPENAAWTKSNSFVQQNLLLNSDTLATQNVTTAATPYTLSFYGTGTVTLSGTSTAGPLVGTGASNRVTLTFTPTAGTLTLTVTGSVTQGQLVQGSVPGDYRATTSAALPCLYADYNGALRARKFCEDATASTTHRILPNTALTIDAAGTYAYSWYVKAGELTEARLTDNNVLGATFNLTTGASSSVSSGYTASSVSLGNGWWRLIISGAAATASGRILIYLSKAGSTTYTGDGSSGIYIADAQLNEGSSALSYYDTTASAYNAPRFDYDPVTLAAKGLLVEESRANLLLQSNDFQTSWSQNNVTRTLNSILSPSGNVDGVKIAATTTAAGTSLITPTATVAATSATYSIFVKQGTGATTANEFALRNFTTATTLILGTLNYSTGVWTYSTGSTGVVVTNAGNGYWRLQISVTSGITSGDTVRGYVGWTGGAATAGDFLYAYGAQLEAGAFATSYIPTTASQVTRAADVASVNTLSPWYNSVAGTLYAEFDSSGVDGSNQSHSAVLGDNTVNNYMGLRCTNAASDQRGQVVINGGVGQSAITIGGYTGQITKSATTLQQNNFTLANNGVIVGSDTSGTLPSVSALFLGSRTSVSNLASLNGHLRRVTFYPRVLTNAELQTLTTL